jgi:SsrA-binding protein
MMQYMARVENRKARFDYEIVKKFTGGIELLGLEVKSVRAGKINLRGAFVGVRGGEVFLIQSEIPPYQPKNAPVEYDARRARKLLFTKDEIEELAQAEQTKGLTIVPLSVYNKGKFLKVDIAVARGKKEYDKREAIKKRDTERDLRRNVG